MSWETCTQFLVVLGGSLETTFGHFWASVSSVLGQLCRPKSYQKYFSTCIRLTNLWKSSQWSESSDVTSEIVPEEDWCKEIKSEIKEHQILHPDAKKLPKLVLLHTELKQSPGPLAPPPAPGPAALRLPDRPPPADSLHDCLPENCICSLYKDV